MADSETGSTAPPTTVIPPKKRLLTAWRAAGEDNISIIAAGVAYFAFLALVPLLAAAVLSYGLLADPETVARHIALMAERLPGPAAEIIGSQLEAVVETSSGKKGTGLALALGLALFGARNGAGATIAALGVAFDLPDRRTFLRRNLLAVAITLAAIVGAGLAAVIVGITAFLGGLLPQDYGAAAALAKVLGHLVLLAAGMAGAGMLYRFGPDRRTPVRFLTAGATMAGASWMVLTLGFGFYVANFGNYNATYGALGAVVVLLTWLYLSAYALLLGAEIDQAGSPTPT